MVEALVSSTALVKEDGAKAPILIACGTAVQLIVLEDGYNPRETSDTYRQAMEDMDKKRGTRKQWFAQIWQDRIDAVHGVGVASHTLDSLIERVEITCNLAEWYMQTQMVP